jgi:hypothetical protein
VKRPRCKTKMRLPGGLLSVPEWEGGVMNGALAACAAKSELVCRAPEPDVRSSFAGRRHAMSAEVAMLIACKAITSAWETRRRSVTGRCNTCTPESV